MFLETVKTWLCLKNSFSRNDLRLSTGLSNTTIDEKLKALKSKRLIVFDKNKKCFLGQMAVKFTSTDFLHSLTRIEKINSPETMLTIPEVVSPQFNIRLTQLLLSAMWRKKVVDCWYRGKMSAGVKRYKLSLLQLVKTDGRYHFRAYNHQSRLFGDYVMTRFTDIVTTREPAVSLQDDHEWHQEVEVTLRLNPAQSDHFKQLARWEFKLDEHDSFTFHTTKALQKYHVRSMTKNDYQTGIPTWIYRDKAV